MMSYLKREMARMVMSPACGADPISPAGATPPNPLFGIRIETSEFLTKSAEDWSRVRSPGRARRRRRLGYRQNIAWVQIPDPAIYEIAGGFYMHPETLERLKAYLAARNGGQA